MKTLITKELRENLTLTVLGFVVYGLFLLAQYRSYVHIIQDLAAGGTAAWGRFLQPLTSGTFSLVTAYFFGIFGALLGWFQVHHERHRDMWSFLVHRPMSRTGIFLGKVSAGMVLYLFAAGLPLGLFVAWAILPGHVAAPVEWPMLQPVIAFFLLGLTAYLAGMLTGLLRARWYASRGLPLATVILVAGLIFLCGYFWQAVMILVLAWALLGLAAWGSFQNDGNYSGQKPATKIALNLTFALGAFVVLGVALSVAGPFLLPGRDSNTWSAYLMTRDGLLCKSVRTPRRPAQVLDLEGKPVIDPRTEKAVDPIDFNQIASQNHTFGVRMDDRPPRYLITFIARAVALRPWKAAQGTLWFYSPTHQRLIAYDAASRLPSGSLGPDGFVKGNLSGPRQFDYPEFDSPWDAHILKTRDAVYRIDLENRTATPVFHTTPDDPIAEAIEISTRDQAWKYTLVVTRSAVRLLSPDGNSLWKVPYGRMASDYPILKLSVLEPADRFALWFLPDASPVRQQTRELPIRVSWIENGSVTTTREVPDLSVTRRTLQSSDFVLAFLMPPAFHFALYRFEKDVLLPNLRPERLWGSILAGALLATATGLWLARRYSMRASAQAGWVLFLLLMGIPGLLALLGSQEWPARIPCPQCGRLRIVSRNRCEHCQGVFAPADRTGIEVFEPIT